MTTTVQPPIQRTHQIVGTRNYSYPVSKATFDLIEARWSQDRKPTNPELVTLLTQLLDEVMSGTPAIVDPAVPMATETTAPPATVNGDDIFTFAMDVAARRGWCGVARECVQAMGVDVYDVAARREQQIPINVVVATARNYGRNHGLLDSVDEELRRYAREHHSPRFREF